MFQLFTTCYRWMLGCAKSPWALSFLIFIGIIESIIFPIPPDLLLTLMCLAKPQHALRYAGLLTTASVLGGILGYAIGAFSAPWAHALIDYLNLTTQFEQLSQWYIVWQWWVIFLAGFSPIPYKLFTLSAGLVGIDFYAFVFASAMSRGLRFYLVAILIKRYGEPLERVLWRYIDAAGWLLVFLFVVMYVVFR